MAVPSSITASLTQPAAPAGTGRAGPRPEYADRYSAAIVELTASAVGSAWARRRPEEGSPEGRGSYDWTSQCTAMSSGSDPPSPDSATPVISHGRTARSTALAASTSPSDGGPTPSRLRRLGGILPAAWCRSRYSTRSGTEVAPDSASARRIAPRRLSRAEADRPRSSGGFACDDGQGRASTTVARTLVPPERPRTDPSA